VIAIRNRLLQLYFIRHGETAWSLSAQHTGATEIPLTAHGEDEARQLEPWLRQIAFARVLNSPRQRARRTCELALLGASAEIEPDLSEWDYGDYEGKRTVDLRKERPDWNLFRDGCPGGETPGQVSDRADRLTSRLQPLQGNVALFSHGQFGCALAARWIGLVVIEGRHFALGAASLSILGHEASHPRTPVIALWNAVPTSLSGGLTDARQRIANPVRDDPARQLDPIGKSGRSGPDQKLGCRHHDHLRPSETLL
jgi:probable phosphoglycerate mutase